MRPPSRREPLPKFSCFEAPSDAGRYSAQKSRTSTIGDLNRKASLETNKKTGWSAPSATPKIRGILFAVAGNPRTHRDDAKAQCRIGFQPVSPDLRTKPSHRNHLDRFLFGLQAPPWASSIVLVLDFLHTLAHPLSLLETHRCADDMNERTIELQFGHSNLFPIRSEVAIG